MEGETKAYKVTAQNSNSKATVSKLIKLVGDYSASLKSLSFKFLFSNSTQNPPKMAFKLAFNASSHLKPALRH